MHYKTVEIKNLKELQAAVIKQLPDVVYSTAGIVTDYGPQIAAIPELQQVFEDANLSEHVADLHFICLPPHTELPIHNDGHRLFYSFNIPILNCENTYIAWYSSTEEPKKVVHKEGHWYLGVPKETCTEIARAEMSQARIVDIDVLHSAINPNNTNRVLLAVRLKNTYSF
jgi:(2Fe-2S) ferredoxin